MNVCIFLHSCKKCTDSYALVDSGATENFMRLTYARHLRFPIHRLNAPRLLYNVDGTINRAGEILWYMDLKVQTGTQHTWMQFFLSNLGNQNIILGYPWFVAVQPKIDWRSAWIDIGHLPIVLRAKDAAKARFLPRRPPVPPQRPTRIDQMYLSRVIFDQKPA